MRSMKRARKTLRAKVRKIIKPAHPTQPEKAEISIDEADDLYREIRIENRLTDEKGKEARLKEGAEVELQIEAEKEANRQEMRSPSSQSCKSVLIVDDNPWIRKVLCERFQRGADLVVCGEAENGEEAIEKAQQRRPALIVLDLSMPVMNGLDAARILRRLMPSVPLIMYSAFGDKLIERQARLIGIRALVSKSQDAAVLISKARSLLTPRAA